MTLIDYTKILDKITPSSEELKIIKQATDKIVSIIYSSAKKNNIEVDIVPGGSTAKGTFLKGNHDVDIFVRFKTEKNNISNELEIFLKDLAKEEKITVERIHGSRDYFNFVYKDLHFELVPVKLITLSTEADNVTDMSPLHVFWVEKYLNDELRKDILLAKQFCKAQGVYGAESYINGISGHVLDILLIHYGSFESFLENVSRWEEPVVIDHEKKHEDVFKSMNKAKLESPLIVVDPIDQMRNASAAICEEKFDKLVFAANEFLAQASEDFFTIKPFVIDEVKESKEKNELFLALEIKPLEGHKDVVGTKILKIFEYIQREMTEYGFTINRSSWNFNDLSHIYFFIDSKSLEKEYVRKGPPAKVTEGAKQFKEKHGDSVFEKDAYLHVTLKREFIEASDFLSWIIKEEFCNSRAMSIKLLL